MEKGQRAPHLARCRRAVVCGQARNCLSRQWHAGQVVGPPGVRQFEIPGHTIITPSGRGRPRARVPGPRTSTHTWTCPCRISAAARAHVWRHHTLRTPPHPCTLPFPYVPECAQAVEDARRQRGQVVPAQVESPGHTIITPSGRGLPRARVGGEEEEMQSASKRVHSPKLCEAVKSARRQVAEQVLVQIEAPGDETRGSQRSLFSRTCSRRVHQHAHAHAHERVWVRMYARACVESTSLDTYQHAHTSARAHTHTRTRTLMYVHELVAPYQYMHTCISYQSCACMHHNDLYFMRVNMHMCK